MRDVYSKIDKSRVENLKKLSKKQYDEIDFERPFSIEDYLCQAESMDEQEARKILNEKQD